MCVCVCVCLNPNDELRLAEDYGGELSLYVLNVRDFSANENEEEEEEIDIHNGRRQQKVKARQGMPRDG